MRKLVVLIMFLIAFETQAQKALLSEKEQRKLAVADQQLHDKHYGKANALYHELLELNESNVYLKLRMAETCVALHNGHEAREWYMQAFQKAGREMPEDALPVHVYQYAETLLSDGKLEEALYWYDLYQQRNPADSRTARKIAGIRRMMNAEKSSAGFEVGGISLNSKYADFSPTFYDKGLVFVSARSLVDSKNGGGAAGAVLDLYYSELLSDGSFSEPSKFSEAINTAFNEGPSVFYDRDKRIIFTRNYLKGKIRAEDEDAVVQLQLFYAEMDTIARAWKKPELLNINSDLYSIGHPALSGDGQHLYFSSNMPGGYGDTDLYVSDQVNGKWSEPKNLGPTVNTEGNEMFPFVYADSVLYFSSDGHEGFGGLDIYRYSLRNQRLENMGAPVNGGRDDFGLILEASGEKGYFSSSRNETDAGKNDDIFYLRKKVVEKPVENPAPLSVAPEEPVVAAVVEQTPEPVLEIYYTIQILAVKNRNLVKKSFLKDLKGVLKYDGKDGLYRYTYGRFDSKEEAIAVLDEVKSQGYSDAFLRREESYKDLSETPGIAIDPFYK